MQRASVIVKRQGSEARDMLVYVKGAPETIARLCEPHTVPADFHPVLQVRTETNSELGEDQCYVLCVHLLNKAVAATWNLAKKNGNPGGLLLTYQFFAFDKTNSEE